MITTVMASMVAPLFAMLSHLASWELWVGISIISAIQFYWKTRPLAIPLTIPGPKRYPYIGYLLHVLRYWHVWPTETTRLAKLYKRTWGGPLPNLGGLPGGYFYIHDEVNIKYILSTNFDNYVKGSIWRKVFGEMLGKGIFAVDGDRWKVHRKLMSNMFSRNLLRHTAVVMQQKLRVLLDLFKKRNAEDGDFTIDIQDIFFRLTIDVTSIVTFDMDLQSVENEKQHEFALAFDEIGNLCQKRFTDPFFEIKKALQLSYRERRIGKLKRMIDDFAYKVIASKRRDVDKGSQLGPDLLSRFIDYAERNNEEILDNDLRDVVMNVLLAGRDTTACALSWTFYELTRHPKVIAKIKNEVDEVCGAGDGAEYSYETISKLKYVHCVALEVLRLHPPVAEDPRYAVKDDVLPDGTRIPAGVGIDLCFYAMGRKEEIWGDDALDFRPERFIGEKEPSLFKYTVFNAGPRTCLGRPLALMDMKLVMSILLTSDFEFIDHKGHTGEYLWTLVESIKGGFEVAVTKRK